MIKKINDMGYVVKMDQWDDESKYWRAGLDWLGEDVYEYVCEKPTLKEALNLCMRFAERFPKGRKK